MEDLVTAVQACAHGNFSREARGLGRSESYELMFDRFSKSTPNAEPPLVLAGQREWIDEPERGHFIPRKEERIAERQVGSGGYRAISELRTVLRSS
jgi:hypothetical protein